MRLERQAGLYLQTASTVEAELKLTGINFLSFAEKFRDLVGAKPYAEIIAQRDDDFAHEGTCVSAQQQRGAQLSTFRPLFPRQNRQFKKRIWSQPATEKLRFTNSSYLALGSKLACRVCIGKIACILY